jgi:hypothetical protein
MNWTALEAVAQLVGSLAVLITLLYLARQVRQSNRQDMLNAYRHTYDSLNEFARSVVESEEVPAIVLRGRRSYQDLSEAERLRFDHLHFVFLNILESHYYQVMATAMDDEYRQWALGNLAVLVRGYLDYPGAREFWGNVQPYYQPAVRKLIEQSLGDATTCDTTAA